MRQGDGVRQAERLRVPERLREAQSDLTPPKRFHVTNVASRNQSGFTQPTWSHVVPSAYVKPKRETQNRQGDGV